MVYLEMQKEAIQGKYRGNTGEIQGKYRGNTGEIQVSKQK